MAISKRDDVVRLLGRLDAEGFKRKSGRVWNRATAEATFAFEAQRSAYSNRYMINVGIVFMRLGPLGFVSPNRCDYYGRMSSDDLESALDLEQALDFADREAIVSTFLTDVVLPAAIECGSERGAMAFVQRRSLSSPLVAPRARGSSLVCRRQPSSG